MWEYLWFYSLNLFCLTLDQRDWVGSSTTDITLFLQTVCTIVGRGDSVLMRYNCRIHVRTQCFVLWQFICGIPVWITLLNCINCMWYKAAEASISPAYLWNWISVTRTYYICESDCYFIMCSMYVSGVTLATVVYAAKPVLIYVSITVIYPSVYRWCTFGLYICCSPLRITLWYTWGVWGSILSYLLKLMYSSSIPVTINQVYLSQ